MILKCTCTHKEQDKLHGKNMRVHNKLMKTKGTQQVVRCSVCGNEKTVSL